MIAIGKKVCVYAPGLKDINEATRYYINIIMDGVANGNVKHVSHIRDLLKYDIVITLDAKSFFFTKLSFPRKKIINWFQGVVPEEAMMIFNSRFRYCYWSLFEYFTLKYAHYNIFVSDKMLEHYVRKYKYKKSNYTVMPCFNSEINTSIIRNNSDKYSSLSFVYAGSLHKWQCIMQTLYFFKKVQLKYPDALLLFLTFDKIKAQKLVDDLELNNVRVDSVSENELPFHIAKCHFGFLIREESIVNQVATPTKMSSYLSVGTIPIFTSAIEELNEKINIKNKFVYSCREDMDSVITKFEEYFSDGIDVELLIKEYENVFETYYNKDFYKSIIRNKVKELGVL
ncbi:hypothetical protein ACUVZB_000120 [Citrobacter freundii]|uniref:hypothetical protein n=1 Tax=Citrobacter freundii TaxID=546 RepID=UPI00177B0673|nr:hypothetical protein [Citrobacter freundii]MBD9990823.1 glycosyltransferase family 4 protein [Citrobacter freundii]MBE0055584.1 glycosyltransferase family 4 protein [Citrobacter freundii]